MKVKSIRLENFRSFVDSGTIELGQINVLIGANNSGKTSVLRGLHQLQQGLSEPHTDARVNTEYQLITIDLQDLVPALANQLRTNNATIIKHPHAQHFTYQHPENRQIQVQPFPNQAPNHFIVPVLSKRKTTAYSEVTNLIQANLVGNDMSNLAAILSRLANSAYLGYHAYIEACEAIVGFQVTAVPVHQGQLPGTYLPDGSTLLISQMGEGVPNIVHLIASLVVSKNKLFLIEEPENDLHPTALKALLDLIIKSSIDNQFVISTHSNIVMSHLGAEENCHIFKVSAEKSKLPPEAKIERVLDRPGARIAVLQELGYSFADFDLWEGWLLLEESSAESIIRKYLIPWFVPSLEKRIRTVSAAGATKVEPTFTDLHRLMLFTHLQPAYAGRAWVRVDGDEAGEETVAKLREKYPTITPDHFQTYPQPQFEYFYPKVFEAKITTILATQNKDDKRKAKTALLINVLAWLDEDHERGKVALEKSASDVIADLKNIASQFPQSRVVPTYAE